MGSGSSTRSKIKVHTLLIIKEDEKFSKYQKHYKEARMERPYRSKKFPFKPKKCLEQWGKNKNYYIHFQSLIDSYAIKNRKDAKLLLKIYMGAHKSGRIMRRPIGNMFSSHHLFFFNMHSKQFTITDYLDRMLVYFDMILKKNLYKKSLNIVEDCIV